MMWNPWRGCKKISEGCRFCYIYKGDEKRGADTSRIIKTNDFDAPLVKNNKGVYKMKPGTVYTCFQSDFLIEEADVWRPDCWKMMLTRRDCHFLFLTKRIHRFASVLPDDWGKGYDNVTVGVSCENRQAVMERLPVLSALAIRHKNIILQPLIEEVSISPWLNSVELVVVGGEYGEKARPLHYEWVLGIRDACIKAKVAFEFRQCGTHFIKDGHAFVLPYNQLGRQAKKANIDYTP